MKTVSIIGVGRIGGALAISLSKKNYKIENLFTNSPEKNEKLLDQIDEKPNTVKLADIKSISSEIIFITTQDSEIEKVVEELKGKIHDQQTYIFHTSGSLSSEILNNLNNKNCFVGSIHPLVSISDPTLGNKRFQNAYFCIEGDEEAVKIAEKIVEDLGGKSFSIETKYKSLYHASAVTACGHLVALIDVAMEMLGKCGLDENKSKEILTPLIKSTVDNLAEQKNSEALTGTFARADFETLKEHVKAIQQNTDEKILEIYLNLGERSLKLAKEQGTEAEKLKKMAEEISLAKNNLKC